LKYDNKTWVLSSVIYDAKEVAEGIKNEEFLPVDLMPSMRLNPHGNLATIN